MAYFLKDKNEFINNFYRYINNEEKYLNEYVIYFKNLKKNEKKLYGNY